MLNLFYSDHYWYIAEACDGHHCEKYCTLEQQISPAIVSTKCIRDKAKIDTPRPQEELQFKFSVPCVKTAACRVQGACTSHKL